MRTAKETLAPIGAVIGAIATILGYVATARDLLTWGLPVSAWQGVGAFLFFVSFTAIVLQQNRKIAAHQQPALANSAELRLHFYGDERAPTRISALNVWRWYYLRNIVVLVDRTTGAEQRRILANLFVTFDNPVSVGTLEVTSSFSPPQHEVKEFTNRYAIIAFSGDLPSGDLTLIVRL